MPPRPISLPKSNRRFKKGWTCPTFKTTLSGDNPDIIPDSPFGSHKIIANYSILMIYTYDLDLYDLKFGHYSNFTRNLIPPQCQFHLVQTSPPSQFHLSPNFIWIQISTPIAIWYQSRFHLNSFSNFILIHNSPYALVHKVQSVGSVTDIVRSK